MAAPRKTSRLVKPKGASRRPRPLWEQATRRTTTCTPNVRWYYCHHCGRVKTLSDGCGRASCTCKTCRSRVGRPRSKALWERLWHAGNVPWASIVVTLPHSLMPRDKVHLTKMAAYLWPIVVAWVQDTCFHGDRDSLGGSCSMHPGNDDGTWNPHWNFLIPLRNSSTVGRYHVKRAALDDLRKRLGNAFNVAYLPQVDYEYKTKLEQKAHAVRYFPRHFPMWKPWAQRTTYHGIFVHLDYEFPHENTPPYSDPDHDLTCCGHRMSLCTVAQIEAWERERTGGLPP